ncbi:reverse transcriptase domain-containing protein [Tanacetum coccineum]
MRTRSQSRRRRQQQTPPVVVENFDLEEPIVDQNIVAMADNRTMAQMLQAPIEGYEDAIVVPPINANNFELKQPLINLVQSNKFTGRQDPHNHLRFFNKVTSTFRHPEVPNTSIKLLLFPFSLDGEARDWLDKEPPRSILTWDDLVAKFINQFFPPSKTTYYRNEIITFFQKPNETFNEAWERFKGLLRQCPHHGFSELHQLDTFYNSLNSNDQDALDSAAGGNFLDKMPQEGLAIIESKSKVRYSRSRANDSRVSTDAPLSNSSPSNNSFDIQQLAASLEDKMTIRFNQMAVQSIDEPSFANFQCKFYDPEERHSDSRGTLNNDPLLHQTKEITTRNSNKNLNYVVRKKKSSIEFATSYEPKNELPEVELKELPLHLEYAFLEENNKLPVIISKDLSQDEKTSLINVPDKTKTAIAWRVNPKIHDVIKKEVEKLLEAGLIYPISDSPWVSPVHSVPKNGGMTVVKEEGK